ncbi:MAG: TIGR03960 family B12-binding radical SAM protein [Candidatus Aminicenantes bacterium]|nr:TIGR03960 family B12-binding radical SAM protein [Candidatus Aminicenantes bacterium]
MFDPKAAERLFPLIEKPGRYTGGEWNSVRKDPARVRVSVALAFPDVYEIGMSYLGQKILYDLLNARPSFRAERVFAPWPDMEEALRASGSPLFSLESRTPLSAFDVVGFSLLYELNYSNILTMLDLGGITLWASDRPDEDPLVIAGGPAVFNPEPVADFFDAFVAGDGEEAFPEILDLWACLKSRGARRPEILRALSGLRGVYVPSLYEAGPAGPSPLRIARPRRGPDGSRGDAPYPVEKRVLTSFARSPFPTDIVVPNVESVFDRVSVEVARGCPQKCRFCQATSLYAPYRVKNPEAVVETALRSVARTGYEDASLFSLSVSDYPYLTETVRALMSELEPRRASLSLSSLRPKGLSAEIADEITKVRKTGFTLVAEAGTDRLRRVINKDLTEQDLLDAAANAFRGGWRLLKLYVMIGLPTETWEDVEAIAQLAERLTFLGRETTGGAPQINLSVSSFIPKPHTPFQWVAMDAPETLRDKQRFLKDRLYKRRNVKVKTHPLDNSLLEAVFSRGDRRLAGVLLRAWKFGARFDSWGDRFRFELWQRAFEAEDVDPAAYLSALDLDAELPWDHMATGMTKAFLRREYERAMAAEPTPSCLEASCGACRGCAFLKDMEKSFSAGLCRSESAAPPEKPAGDGEDVRRYEVAYAKEGLIRFIGHNDLVHTIQRTFRRAGIPVAYSEGFHPKMRMSFLPPLALGMEGRDERLEFKTRGSLNVAASLEALISCAPEGLRFLRLELLNKETPPLSRRLRRLIYGIDLSAPPVREAVNALLGEKSPEAGLRPEEFFRRKAGEANFPPDSPKIEVDASGNRLVLTYDFNPQKAPRPQDALSALLGISDSAYVIVRDSVVLDPVRFN